MKGILSLDLKFALLLQNVIYLFTVFIFFINNSNTVIIVIIDFVL